MPRCPPPRPWRFVVTLALTAALASGCSPSLREASSAVAAGATPGVIAGAGSAFEDPQTRARIERIMDSPEFQKMLRTTTADAARGILDGLNDDEVAAKTEKLVRSSVHAALLSVLARENIAEIQRASGMLTESIVHGAMRAVAADMQSELGPRLRQVTTDAVGPALQDVVRANVTPGLAEMLRDPELRASLGGAVRVLAHDAVLGSNEGLADLEKQKGNHGLLATAAAFFMGKTWLLALVVVTMLGGVVLMAKRYRKVRVRRGVDTRRRDIEEAVRETLARTMRAAVGKPWEPDLRRALREDAETATLDSQSRIVARPRADAAR